MKQLEMLYEGKAKQVFRTDDPDTNVYIVIFCLLRLVML